MKKRIFMLALLAALVLSVCGSAWAGDAAAKDYYFKLGDTAFIGKELVDSATKTVTVSFQVKVKVKVVDSGESAGDDTFTKSANLLKWTVTEDNNGTFTPTSITIKRSDGSEITNATAAFLLDPYYVIGVSSEWEDGNATAIMNIAVTGTMTRTADDVSIAVKLYNKEDKTLVTSETISDATTEADTGDVDTTVEDETADTLDERDPSSVLWNGLDPIFYHKINTASYDISKVKPKLGKIDKTKLTFKGGKEGTLVIPMTGPIQEFDVYIAQKDAKKLYPASADSITENIRLTSDNIRAYKIPFRVTAIVSVDKVSGTTAKDQQKAWKAADKNKLTLSFNGANLQYKGFPITISMANDNTGSKPVAKAIKLNIEPNTSIPGWTYEVLSNEITTDESTYEEWAADETNEYAGEYSSSYKYVDGISAAVTYGEAGSEVTVIKAMVDSWLGITTTVGTPFLSGDYDYYVVSNDADNTVYTTSYTADSWYRTFYVTKTITKSDKLEASTWVKPDAGDNEKKTEAIDEVYTASADAPYAISIKPDLTKDSAKITKFFTSAASIDVVQPVYDYLGNVKTHGYVRLRGIPAETTKESKLAFTLTATNPSTKKKGAAKVTANAKTFPVFDKTDNVTVAKAAFESMDYDAYYYGDETPDTAGNITITYKRIPTKRVQAGKAPSVKPKAKGSKTISYKLGLYTVEDGEVSAVDDDFNTELATKLVALGLSFDAKKGVYAPDKTKLKTPTLDETGEAFKSLDIAITAVNNVGYDQAWAHVAITGAKPALSTKEVEFKKDDKAYSFRTFKLKAGKDEVNASTTTANVKATETSSELEKYGLAMVTYDQLTWAYDSYDVIGGTSATAMPTGWTPDSKDLVNESDYDNVEAVKDNDDKVTGYQVTAGETVQRYNGKIWTEVSSDARYKNLGIIQIMDYSTFTSAGDSKSAKGVKAAVALENFGATNKGSLKVKVPAATSSSGALPASLKALANNGSSSSAAKAKTNGTAGLTYNGAAPDADAEAEAEAEGTVTFGAPRTVADLTAGQQAFLAEKGCTVVAVLPEITADVSDQYKLEDIELDEDAPEGATLIWIAFPKNAPASEDDEIVDFYDEAGTPVEGVPASHKIIASPWLREAVTYEPVIAIEAE